ncbi:MAG: Ig-like domain-containing protein [Bacteroidaceae bacterium]|nr:Ig-like domain-containing protein [Bacteroidaceae bacterium]
MRKYILSALLIVAGMQMAWAQGFRVYQSDGTQLQFSLSTDSIVFDNGLSGEEVFGPFTPVNQCIAKTWYMSNTESFTFNADGTTNYMEGGTYEFFPYQGTLLLYDEFGVPVTFFKVMKLTAEKMIVSTNTGNGIMVWSASAPVQYVTDIILNNLSLTLNVNAIKTLTATVLPEDADNKELEWTSSDSGIAWVNQNGLVIGNAEGTCTITCSATDGSGVKAECLVTVKSSLPDTHEYVDLGLPSGTLWATCNVGAYNPEEYGDYFAWGETTPKDDYSLDTYLYSDGPYYNKKLTKYCQISNKGYNGFTDDLTELLPEDDAATANWGNKWQTPSQDQLKELFGNHTSTSWTTLNGVEGMEIRSRSNGKTIFLPAAGYYFSTSFYGTGALGTIGSYWSRSLKTSDPANAFSMSIWIEDDIDNYEFDSRQRDIGLSVRPVRVP